MCMWTDIDHSSETQVFLRHVNDIVRTVSDDSKDLLDTVNNLNPNLQCTLETVDDKNSSNVEPEGTIFCT